MKRHENWKPIFGQAEAAQGHLRKHKISIDDIFLFFGWFRQTEFIIEKYFYKYGSPDKDLAISYHTKDSFKQDYFQSAAKGQEFVIEANDDLIIGLGRMSAKAGI